MIWEPEVQILHSTLPDHENRMLERILTGPPGLAVQVVGTETARPGARRRPPASLLWLIA